MEKFYRMRELVALCCSNGENFPNPKDYACLYYDEKTANFGTMLPDGSFHGPFTKFYENFTEVITYDRGVKHGPWSKSSKRARCDGNFVDGKPEGEFIISQRVEIPSNAWPKKFRTSTSSVFYEKGKGVKHVHNSGDFCPFECSFLGMTLRESHTVDWTLSPEIWFKVTTNTITLEGRLQDMEKGCHAWNSLWCWSELLPGEARRLSPSKEEGICIVLP
ncbi:hypothetical protein A9K97_gp192 [Tokyovirus A1]|uniref:hypothetical protein n=1 Tax=Tokyovirus A1 TaxID=1826170 RepID=UPI0007A976E6|nr:hypothetical protein A9K97_gp192 [Tokyovirus A1]BAU80159.1 hypothetical protein [Tokyovirus A1]